MSLRVAAEHTTSYYAASARYTDTYPPLQGDERCDVAVVGGGFTGVSAALFLVERGYDVILVEANRVGWGASGRNGGQLIDGFVAPGKLDKRLGADAERMAYDMGLECREIVLQRIAAYDIDCDLKSGYVDTAVTAREMAALEDFYAFRERMGYPHAIRLLGRDELRDYLASDAYVGGGLNPGNGHLQPLDLCAGEARAAASLGARIFEQSPVLRIHHGAAPRVETLTGTVHANKVLLAGNAYLGGAEPRLSGAVIPSGSYIMATAPLGEEVARELLPQDTACCEERVGLNYFRLSSDRRLLFGGMCNYSGRAPRSVAGALRPRMLKIFPQLEKTPIEFEWGGDIAISLNRIPQFGRIDGNTYYAQGYSGHGVAPTHLAGKMLADVVAGDSEQFDVFSRVKHWRLPGGKWFANPALALGMMYYRIKELL